MEQKIPTTAGNLKVSEEVVSTIVKQVISENEGVYDLVAPPVTPKEAILKSGVSRPVKIGLSGGDVAVIDVSVRIKMGYRVKDIAEKIQNSVKEEVQHMAGITVSAVNVYIADVVSVS